MKYVYGRDNMSATIHVPFECGQNCEFCNVKDIYTTHTPNKKAVLDIAAIINQTFIPEVVISGGEPLADVKYLDELIQTLSNKPIYINTCLPQNSVDFLFALVRKHKNIKGINISRHAACPVNELLQDIAGDSTIKDLATICNVRINCVLTDRENVAAIIKRWNMAAIHLNLREDYTKLLPENLHNMIGIPAELLSMRFMDERHCNVCQTYNFDDNGQRISYHKGLANTLIGNEVNDIIVYPDGTVTDDWGKAPLSYSDTHSLLFAKRKNDNSLLLEMARALMPPSPARYDFSQCEIVPHAHSVKIPLYTHTCGSSGCGGRSMSYPICGIAQPSFGCGCRGDRSGC